ncbi:MAG TPA: hypothetical protein VFF49_04870 [Thermodesulfobacteriota bacterium]|nr:hypothetical protein [Thermodesulfobacteriota bacterium]
MAQEFEVGKAPWEMGEGESRSEFEVGKAPWEMENVVNEMHPNIDWMTRFKFKNFSIKPEVALEWLKKTQPNLEWKKDDSGEIVAKTPQETTWRKLDPKGFDIQDITDVIGSDVPGGITQGLATAAGALGGGLPGAMGASALSGAGVETLRQALGQSMGFGGMAPEEIGVSAGLGAILPTVFGGGLGVKEAIKAATKPGASKTAEELLKSQRGLLGRGYDVAAGKIGPYLGTVMSGESPTVLRKAATILPEIQKADLDPNIVVKPLEVAAKEVNKTLKGNTTQIGKRLEEIRDTLDAEKIGISKRELYQPFLDLAETIQKGAADTPAQRADIAFLTDTIKKEFSGLPDMLTAAQMDNLRRRFKERAQQFGMNYGRSGQAVSTTQGASAIDAQISGAFEESRRKITDIIVDRLSSINPNLAGEYVALNSKYSTLKTLQKETLNKTKNAKSFGDFLMKSTKDPNAESQLMDIVMETGLDLPDLAAQTQAIKTFSKPSTSVRSLGGSTSTSKTIPLATAGGAAGYYLGQKLGFSPFISGLVGGTLGAAGGSPAMMRKYMETSQLVRQLPQYIPGYKYTPYLTTPIFENNKQERK